MISALATVAYCFASALFPLFNAEIYLGAVGAASSRPELALLAVAAAAGQTGGKILWFAGGRWVGGAQGVKAKLATPKLARVRAKWDHYLRSRPRFAYAVVFTSGVVGFPPLLLVSMLGSSTGMHVRPFAASCFAGRLIRFGAILFGASALVHLLP